MVAWYFKEDGVVILKRVVWYFKEDGVVILKRVLKIMIVSRSIFVYPRWNIVAVEIFLTN